MCEAVTGRRKEVGKSKVVENGELKWVQDSVICRGFLILTKPLESRRADRAGGRWRDEGAFKEIKA
jgi:hypothetical protein